ncbi:ABC transporter ATP-binding protein [Kitasatospora sp. NPDC085879]|uniref:ABC transporter ATP-binding protein n=1 Tax=Kitasatospora sp. NPDC085879 TaxID=3154769 RepID=UPI003413D962
MAPGLAGRWLGGAWSRRGRSRRRGWASGSSLSWNGSWRRARWRTAGRTSGLARSRRPRLTARDNLMFFGMLAGFDRRTLTARSATLLTRMGLDHAADRRVEAFSKGMCRRLHLACGLVSEPQILLLDEPTIIGLDPEEAARLRDTVRALAAAGTTVLLTSHYLLDIDRMTDRVLMLNDGRITHDLATTDFRALAGHVATATARGTGPTPDLPEGLLRARLQRTDTGWQADVPIPAWDPGTLTAIGAAFTAIGPHTFDVRPVALDDVFSLVSG